MLALIWASSIPVASASAVQVIIYLYALPLTGDRCKELQLHGQVSYQDHTVDVPAAVIDQKFTDRLAGLIRRIAADIPTIRVPSSAECRFCDITGADCPERIDEEPAAEGDTADLCRERHTAIGSRRDAGAIRTGARVAA